MARIVVVYGTTEGLYLAGSRSLLWGSLNPGPTAVTSTSWT